MPGAGLMWRGHSLRRPRLKEHGFHRAFPFVLGLFAMASFVLGPEIAGLTRIWIIGWAVWVVLIADLPPGLPDRLRRFIERLAGTRPPATSPSAG